MQVTWSLVAGGAETYALKIASGLNPDKYRGLMCAIDQGGALEPEIRGLGIPYFIMNRRPGIEIGLMWRLFKLFKKEHVGVVHTHHFNQLFYSAIGAKLAGARLVHTEHSVEYLKRRRLRFALKLLSLLCHRVVAIGSDGARVLSETVGIPERKIEIITAGVDPSEFNESKSDARRALGFEGSDRIAVIIARLYPEKNHRLLLEAFEEVAQAVPGAKLLIAGEGTERRAIEDEITRLGLSESALVLGVRRDVSRLLAASDVFVLSSDREGLPIAVLEAMAAAKPVVATSVGDLLYLVSNGETGLLVPAGDARAIAGAMIELFNDPERAERMGARARRFIEENYNLTEMIAKHEFLYGPM